MLLCRNCHNPANHPAATRAMLKHRLHEAFDFNDEKVWKRLEAEVDDLTDAQVQHIGKSWGACESCGLVTECIDCKLSECPR